MKQIQIAEVINTQLVMNALGLEEPIAEDLSNIVEVMKKIQSASADDAKNMQKTLFIAFNNYFLSRELGRRDLGIYKETIAYLGGIQRIMNAGLLSAQDSHILNLVNGESYLDGKYYGNPTDARIATETKTFKVVVSNAPDTFAENFASAEKAVSYWSMVQVNATNTITKQLNELEKRLVTMLAYKCVKAGRKIPVVTAFNAENFSLGPEDEGFVDYDAIKKDRKLRAYFNDWLKEVGVRVKDAMGELNAKYNDGTVQSWTPEGKLNIVMLSIIGANMKYLSDPVDINAPDGLSYKTISCWQTPGADILPGIAEAATIKIKTGENTSDTVNNVIGVIFDSDAASMNTALDKVTIEEVGAEGFRNFHHHFALNYYIDERLGAVALVLE